MSTILVATDKFKGSLSAREVADAIADGLHAGDPELRIVTLPIADGGEGTVAAAVAAGATPHHLRVAGPVGRPVNAELALLRGTAVVELAQGSGLTKLPPGVLAPMEADSFGTGQLVRAALDLRATQIVLGVGGSACTDGGAGMLTALGARFVDRNGMPVCAGGRGLRDIASVDLSQLDRRLAVTPLTLASDVSSPLLGPNGAATVYGPQKGADTAQVRELDSGLQHLVAVLTEAMGPQVPSHALSPGAGSAGGVGFAALAVLHARRRPGIDLVLEMVNAMTALSEADLVVTGEGRVDSQTLEGKAPAGILRAATRHRTPVLAVTGACDLSAAHIAAMGLIDVLSLKDREPDLDRCVAEAPALLRATGEELARYHLRTGRWAGYRPA